VAGKSIIIIVEEGGEALAMEAGAVVDEEEAARCPTFPQQRRRSGRACACKRWRRFEGGWWRKPQHQVHTYNTRT